jgi:hypothetical protein
MRNAPIPLLHPSASLDPSPVIDIISNLPPVMAGLDPAIHEKRHVDARIKSGQDKGRWLRRMT